MPHANTMTYRAESGPFGHQAMARRDGSVPFVRKVRGRITHLEDQLEAVQSSLAGRRKIELNQFLEKRR